MEPLHQIFGDSSNDVGWAEQSARAMLVFVYGLALVRIAGRRLFGKFGALDLVVSIIIGSNLSRVLTGNAPVVATLTATTLFFALYWVLAWVAVRSRPFSRLVEGEPVVLGENGNLDERRMRAANISLVDVHEALRQGGVEDAGATRKIVLEPSGHISVLKA